MVNTFFISPQLKCNVEQYFGDQSTSASLNQQKNQKSLANRVTHGVTNSYCRSESDEEAGEQLIADIFGASDEEEEFVVRMVTL